MGMLDWLTGRFSTRGRALRMYKRGMTKARRKNHEGAIVDYTTTIDMSETPIDVRAMALYNRALMYVASGDETKGVADLDAVLAMQEMMINVKTMARQKLARIAALPKDKRRSRRD